MVYLLGGGFLLGALGGWVAGLLRTHRHPPVAPPPQGPGPRPDATPGRAT